MLFEINTKKNISAIDQGLKDAAARHKFGILAVHDLQATMKNKGVLYDRAVYVYEVCNPQQAKRVLDANVAVSTALPCRISVYAEGDGYRLATLKPTVLMQMFGNKELAEVAKDVEETLVAMMKEAAG
jgi:uncharacterized protein (DUF302 family)